MLATTRGKLKIWLGKQTKTEAIIHSTQPSLRELAEGAKEEWQQAQAYFEHVKDQDLVDYAIIKLEAAEKRYDYLLRQLREH